MRKIIEHFVKYPVLANIIIVLTLVAGVVSFLNTKKSFFPTRKDLNIIVSVAYPGASPEEMEEGVTLKIEESLTSIAGIDEINSTSSENQASINIKILENFDIDEIYTDVKNSVDGISSFPAGAEKPIIYKQRQRTTAQWLAVTGDVNLKTLKNYANQVKDELLATGKVSQVEISGYPPLEISIEVDEPTLRRYNLTFDQVASAVRFNNRDVSAGSIKSSAEEILIRSKAKETDAELMGDIVLRSNPDGSYLRVRDVATIKEKFSDVPNKAMINGKEAVFIEVRKLETEDLEEISVTVADYAKSFNEKTDAVELVSTWDFLDLLQQRLDLLTANGITGLLLVLAALGFFLSLRLSFWVAWGIPSAFLGMFILGSFVGLTINMISLFGMILVVGILVDDGIVIAENIYTHFERTKNPVKSAIDGTMEVLPAVFVSVTTTIVAFLPLLFLTGGFEFLKDMAIVVIFSLSFSLLEAFFILPAHLGNKHVLRIKKEDTRSFKIRSALNRIIDFMKYNLYGKALRFTLKYRPVSIAMTWAFAILVVGLLAGGVIKATFFPNIPFNSFNINVSFKPGEREDKVERYLAHFEKSIWKVNTDLKKELATEREIINYTFSNVGFSGDGESGSHAGSINVLYGELDEYGINQYDLINRIQETIGPVTEAEKFSIGGANRFGKPVSIMLMSKNNGELQNAKEFLKQELAAFSDLKEIQDNEPVGKREMLFDLRPQAYFVGLNNNEITRQMRQGFFGEEVQRFMKSDDEIRVWVRYPNSGRSSIGNLEDIKIKTAAGEYPIAQLADYRIERGVSGIRHYNTQRAVTVEAEMVDPFGDVPLVMNKVNETIIPRILANYPTVTIDYGGQSKESARAGKEIGLFFGGAFVLIFFILMINFRSLWQALLIVGIIPLGWLSAMLGHGIEDWISPDKEMPVSLLSVWGMVALSGVIINDAVVFLDRFNSLVKNEGMRVQQAVYEAGISRFRPIMLTSITTVAGLYPLIKETSFQAQFLIPMAISVAYGVLIGTFIILLFFPVFILVLNDFRRYVKWLWTGEKPSRESVEHVLVEEERLAEYKETVY